MKQITCIDNETGLTALDLLQKRAPRAPRSYLRQLLRQGRVQQLGVAVNEGTRLQEGDRLHLPESRRLAEFLLPEALFAIRILLENQDTLAIYKPAGLAVHRGQGHTDNLADRVQSLMRARGEPFRTAPAHRLDAATSGPVLFGKGRRGTGALGRLFRDGQVEKEYLALTAGKPTAFSRLDSPVPAKGKWKESVADLRLQEVRGDFSLVEIRLLSGRTHQIRRQMADAGFPLVGDQRYGGPALPGLHRLFLHCRRLAWRDPASGIDLEVECPLPDELMAILRDLSPPPTFRP